MLWTLPSLLIVQIANRSAHWWTFSASDTTLRGMPLELNLGWAVLWGLVPQLAFPRMPILWSAAIMIAVDLFAMPACAPVVQLASDWLVGESVAAMFVLLPAIAIAQWTREDRHLFLRAAVQIATAGMIFLFLLPEVIFALRPGDGWTPLLRAGQLAFQAIALLAVPGISGVLEFAERGSGTPIPYDPPQRLVTSGVYRYVANPMQISCGLVMAAWAILLHNGWMALAATFSFIYSAGIAEWDEGEDLRSRFGAEWIAYRAAVRNWAPRWRPYHSGPPATLYIAATCGPCSELRMWLDARSPIGLSMIAAENLPAGSIRRVRYVPGDGGSAVEGVHALARALEHLHLGWAFVGATMRLPVVRQLAQVLADASGFGPRSVTSALPRSPSALAGESCRSRRRWGAVRHT